MTDQSVITLFAAADAAFLLSVVKPLIVFAVLLGWGWTATWFDKDIKKLFLNWKLWNALQIGVAALAFFLWLIIPIFFVGMVLALLLLGGALGGYVYYRNLKAPPEAQWDLSFTGVRERMEERDQATARERAGVKLLNPDGTTLDVPVGDDPAAQAHQVLEQVVGFVLARGGERIEVQVSAEQARIGGFVDGVRYDMPPVEPRAALSLVDYLKGKAGLDLADRRRRQQATLPIHTENYGQHLLGLSTIGSTRELSLTLVMDPAKRTKLSLEQLGLLPVQRQQIKPMFGEKERVVIVTAPPQQGQTTTLYSLVAQHDPYTHAVATLEEQVAIELEGVTHETIEPGTSAPQLAQKIAALSRRSPDVILLGRMDDAQVAHAVAEAAAESRIYFGMQHPDTFTALKAWVKAVGDLKLAADSLAAVTAQRLLRKLCTTCRVAYKPDPAALRKLNLPADKVSQLYKHTGQVLMHNKPTTCPDCMGIGYRGRIGVFEVMILDDQARQVLAKGQVDQLRAHLRKQRMLWLQEAALFRAVEGATSINEVTRALGGK